jgi:pimeloyl-ACP methyl ester carboxylesterase
MGASSSVSAKTPLVETERTLKDTTFRSVVFNQKDLEFVKSEGQMILKKQVTSDDFEKYMNILRVMARLSRVIYSDSGIIRKIMLDPAFSGTDNNTVNDVITKYDREYLHLKRQPSESSGSIEGRPMASYIIDEIADSTTPFCRYVSSPSDLTFMFVTGDKVVGLESTDVVLVFKGSSTVDNFKHDMMSQFTPVNLEDSLPSGLKMTSTTTGNKVPGSFLTHLTDSWEFIDQGLKKFNPTRLFITGHSLGGAYASLCTFILAENQSMYSVQSFHLITLGSPTVLSDLARNTFNAHLDSGKVTLDRIVSVGPPDFIPKIPVAFSHPGFQPLNTELFPEKAGRAYNISTIKKVYQTGGLALGFTEAKRFYANQTLTHIPNLVRIPTNFRAFAHAGYLDMTWLGGFRLLGMKNPGFKTNTFVSDLFLEGITFKYETPIKQSVTPEEADPSSNADITALSGMAPKGGTRRKKGLRRTRRK